jgi:hypothetical protein
MGKKNKPGDESRAEFEDILARGGWKVEESLRDNYGVPYTKGPHRLYVDDIGVFYLRFGPRGWARKWGQSYDQMLNLGEDRLVYTEEGALVDEVIPMSIQGTLK